MQRPDSLAQNERRKDIAFINNPDNWPCWPRLPMKRGKDVACLVENKPGFTLYHENLFNPITIATTSTHYATAAEVLDDGWVID